MNSNNLEPKEIKFYSNESQNEILKLCENGDIFINGRLAENDKEVVDAMRKFLLKQGLIKNKKIMKETQKQQFNYDNLHDAKKISSRIKVVETIEEAVIGLAQLLKDDPEFFIQEPKQETLEEVAGRLNFLGRELYALKLGAKWQQERSYSEEDMKDAYIQGTLGLEYKKNFNESFYEWFEQFKKK
jgi:hypothetical protein